jgi:FixJ family two-component response regulator
VELPTIFMSGYGEDPTPLGPWDEPATVLQKPFRAEELLRAVGDALGQAEAAR